MSSISRNAAVDTMDNLHALQPCLLCDIRMAVPRSPMCTRCEAEVIDGAEQWSC